MPDSGRTTAQCGGAFGQWRWRWAGGSSCARPRDIGFPTKCRGGQEESSALDAQLDDAGLEGGRLHAQALGGAAVTPDPPPDLVEYRGNVPTLDGLQGHHLGRALSIRSCRRELDVEDRPGAQDDGPLDHVAKLAHVARPGVA